MRRVCNHPGTGLLAAACGDHVVRMYDVEVRIIGFYTGCAELPFLRRSTAVLDVHCLTRLGYCAYAWLPLTTKLAPVRAANTHSWLASEDSIVTHPEATRPAVACASACTQHTTCPPLFGACRLCPPCTCAAADDKNWHQSEPPNTHSWLATDDPIVTHPEAHMLHGNACFTFAAPHLLSLLHVPNPLLLPGPLEPTTTTIPPPPHSPLQAARLVRQFRGHTAPICDMQISADCRWLLTASLDGTVRCWDIPGEQCCDVPVVGIANSAELVCLGGVWRQPRPPAALLLHCTHAHCAVHPLLHATACQHWLCMLLLTGQGWLSRSSECEPHQGSLSLTTSIISPPIN